jgi:hypothetical protein
MVDPEPEEEPNDNDVFVGLIQLGFLVIVACIVVLAVGGTVKLMMIMFG